MDDDRLLCKEIWSLMTMDGGDSIIKLKSLKRREDRRGKVKRLLCRALSQSSLGSFNGMVYYFGGRVYQSIGIRGVKKVLYDIMADRIELPDADLVRLSDIYEDCLNVVFSKPLHVSSTVMIFRNGVLDVGEGKFHRKFDKRFIQMWSVDYDYNPDARIFLWYQFLNQVLPDVRCQEELQMFLGATFIDRSKVKIEHIMILLGKGANGKSVIQKAVCGVLGEQYVATQEIGRLCARGIDGDESVALINGRRLNYCTEMETTDFYRKSARLKAIVSGEKVPARFRYGIGFEAMNIPLLMANANQLPLFNQKDDALLRRIRVIPFEVSIPPERQNRTLNDELVAEYPAILNWILEGRDKFIKNGYRLPWGMDLSRYIRDERDEYNSAIKYMQVHGYRPSYEDVDIAPVTWLRIARLYRDYVRWCGGNGINAMSKRDFNYALINQCGYQRKRMSDGYRIAVFGEVTLRELRKQRTKLAEVKDKTPRAVTMWYNGRLYASSLRSLAVYSDVSFSVVSRLNREGKFHEFTYAYKEKNMYDIKSCCDVMRQLYIIATDEEKQIDSRIRKELKYMRYMFNQRMEYNGWPYRKYGKEEPQIGDWCKVVPDETSDDEVLEMAVKDGLDTSKWSKKRALGMYGKGGKGFFDSADDIPTAEEHSINDKIKSGDYETEEEEEQ